MSITKRCELRPRQLQCVACWPIEMYSSGAVNQLRHFSPSTLACTCACVHARIRTWSSCVCVHERALHERLVCVRAVCVFSRACLRIDVSCACVVVACARSRACVALTSRVRAQPSCVCVHKRACAAVVCARSRACACSRRVCAFTSLRVHRRLLRVCAVCVLSRALWTFGPFQAAKLIKYILILISINMHILIYN